MSGRTDTEILADYLVSVVGEYMMGQRTPEAARKLWAAGNAYMDERYTTSDNETFFIELDMSRKEIDDLRDRRPDLFVVPPAMTIEEAMEHARKNAVPVSKPAWVETA